MQIKLFSILIIIILVFSINTNGTKLASNPYESEPINLYIGNDLDKNTNSIKNQNRISLSNSQIIFTENSGQLKNEEIKFYDQNNRIWFTNDGIWYEFHENIKTEPGIIFEPFSESIIQDNFSYRRVIIKQEFVGANDVVLKGNKKLDSYSNYFYGNNSKNWITNVPNFQEVYYPNLYNGIDICVYSNTNGLKYDLIVHPGADIQQIRIKIKGANKLKIDNFNNVVAETSIGDLIDSDLYIYQLQKGGQYQINGKFAILNDFEYGFELLQDYQRNDPLIIDPGVRLERSTYFGGSGSDIGYNIASDVTGNIYVTGLTYSSDFSTTPGANDTIFSSPADAYVIKLDPSMSKLLYSTFIGGNSIEYGQDIAVDDFGNSFITGFTSSNDFPTTNNAYDMGHNGNEDVFVLKLNANGTKLNYSTFIGGSQHDRGYGIAIDNAGNAYVTGRTRSSDFPITSGMLSFGGIDVIVIKVNSNGSALTYCRVFGGGTTDSGEDIVVDSNGNAFVTGYTQSNDFNITTGVYDPSWNGNYDAFILKLNNSGLSLDYSTYLGGSNADSSTGIDIETNGNIVITGCTTSSDFPNTTGVIDPNYDSMYDAFITKIDQKGNKLIFSTFLNGSNQDFCNKVAIDTKGYVYIIGYTDSTDFTTTNDALNKSHIGGNDVFFLKCNPTGTHIIYSTYIGGVNNDLALGMDLDLVGQVYITGYTMSTDFPTSMGAVNSSYNGGNDIFVVKFTTSSMININSLSLLVNSLPTDTIYSKLCPYTFRVSVTDTANITDLKTVKLILDPLGSNIQIISNITTGKFQKLNDPNEYVILESTNKITNYIYWWTINFNLTFNWTYPQEESNDVQIYATSKELSPTWHNITNLFRVENDLVFNGSLVVEGDNNRRINEFDLIRGGENLIWTGLIPVYENTSDIYPLEDEFDVTVWDELGSFWTASPKSGEIFYVETIAPNITYNTSFTYTIKISDLPPVCDNKDETFTIILTRIPDKNDKSNEIFNVFIDAENVTFSEPTPPETLWQTETEIPVGITIIDKGGGVVNASTIMHRYSTKDGESWSDWKLISGLKSEKTVVAQVYFKFVEGTGNLVKWRAFDSVGNGPNESQPYRIYIDTLPVTFSNFQPLATDVSITDEVVTNITILDTNSGVDASTIEYAISNDRGNTWDDWQQVKDYNDGKKVFVQLNLTFPNGTENMIKWRAKDIAGNGPTESQPYVVLINTWVPLIKPKVTLLSPYKGSKINETSVTLNWIGEEINSDNITYILYFGNKTPVSIYKNDLKNTSYYMDGLVDGEEYYWYVLPKLDDILGTCDSGVWWFEIELTKDIHLYELDISGPTSVSLYPGENKSIEFTIVNLGNKEDIIKLNLEAENLTNYISFHDYSLINLKSKQYTQRKLNLNISKNTKPGFYQIILTAISMNSGEKEKDIHILTLEIKEPIPPEPVESEDKENETKRESFDLFLILLIAIIIIIILILTLIIIITKRKKHVEKDLLPGGTYAIKPGALPSPVITLDQVSAPETVAKLPSTTTITTQQPIVVSTSIPALVKSTVVTKEPIQQLPQLPPAKIYDGKTEESQKSVEKPPSTTTVAQSTHLTQGPSVHLPETPPALQPQSPIAKPIVPTIQQTKPVIQQIPTTILAHPQAESKVREEALVAKPIIQDEKNSLTAPGITPKKLQSTQKKEDDKDY